jgi:hypothetical protein
VGDYLVGERVEEHGYDWRCCVLQCFAGDLGGWNGFASSVLALGCGRICLERY